MAENTILGVGSRVEHPAYGTGVVIRLHPIAYEVCFVTYGIKQVAKEYDEWDIIEQIEADEPVTYTEAERSLMRILRQWSDITEIVPLEGKWKDGVLIIRPQDESLKDKEIPIETFFHKIVMVRDRLRVMEQRINSSNLDDEEKVNLQQYITRIYGSLTTFNVLFKYKEHQFVGERSG